jgi:hypothetical protein
MKSYLNLFFSIAFNVKSAQSFQAIYHPQIKRQTLLQREVGLSHLPPSEYTEQKYSNPLSTNQEASKNKLSQFESLWTKYCMIAYVAHMCVALPISLMPTFVKTKLNMATKAELEHEALQVGQACARSLLQLIPFMNLKVIPHVSSVDLCLRYA